MHVTDEPASPVDTVPDDLADEMMARHVEVQTLADLMGTDNQRGTPIPALQNTFYKFIQNPSTVSVETFKRMFDTDETIGSGVDFLISCMCARLGAYQHDDPEITSFVTLALSEVRGGFINTCKEALKACADGFSISEMVWANREIGFVIEKLSTLPASSVLFEADRTGEITDDGVLQYQRNYNPLMGSGVGYFGSWSTSSGFTVNRPDPMAKFGDMPFPVRSANTFNYLSIRIPKLKVLHYTWNSQPFTNPYGRSLLRRAYNWWVQKWAYAQMMGVALDRKGTPLIIGYADPNAAMVDKGKYSSTEAPKRSDMLKAPAAMRDAFRNVHNDTMVVLPGKKGQIFEVDIVEQRSNATDFVEAINLCNVLIMRALLIPALVFTSGDGAGSYALGQEHAKTFDKILDGYLEGFKNALLDQIVRQLIAYNFPKERWQKIGIGSFAKRELTTDERQKEAEMFEKGVNMGVIDTNDLADLNKMREAFGFEPRTEPIKKPDPFGGFGGDPFGNDQQQETDEDGNPVQPFGKDAQGNAEQRGDGERAGNGDARGAGAARGPVKRTPAGARFPRGNGTEDDDRPAQ